MTNMELPISRNYDQERAEKKRKWACRLLFLCHCLALFCIGWVISSLFANKYFPASVLTMDDPSNYRNFLHSDFHTYVFGWSRPASSALIWVAFTLCHADALKLQLFETGMFALFLVSFFVLLYAVAKNYFVSWFFSIAIIFSRLNWYFMIAVLGMMESLALMSCCFCAAFLIYFIKTRKIWYLLPSFLFYALAFLSHERYFIIGVFLVFFAIVRARGIWLKLLIAILPIAAFGAFYYFRTVVLGIPFWVVTGRTAISLDIEFLLNHFRNILTNTIGFDVDDIWYAGYSNFLLKGNEWHVQLFSYPALALLVCWFPLEIRYIIDKDAGGFWTGLLLLGFCFSLAAAGSVSPERVEMRWVFSAQVYVFALLAYSLNIFFDHQFVRTKERKKAAWVLKTTGVLIALVLSCSFQNSNVFFVQNKTAFYLDNEQSTMDMIYSATIIPMKLENKDHLWVSTSNDFAHFVEDVLIQSDELKSYFISTPANPIPRPAETEIYYYVTL